MIEAAIIIYLVVALRMMQLRCRPYYRKKQSRMKQCAKALVWPVAVLDLAISSVISRIEGK